MPALAMYVTPKVFQNYVDKLSGIVMYGRPWVVLIAGGLAQIHYDEVSRGHG